jgi:hypothetical protein
VRRISKDARQKTSKYQGCLRRKKTANMHCARHVAWTTRSNPTEPTKSDQASKIAELLGSQARPRMFLLNEYRQLAASSTD